MCVGESGWGGGVGVRSKGNVGMFSANAAVLGPHDGILVPPSAAVLGPHDGILVPPSENLN